MTADEIQTITQRAKADATAFLSGWPKANRCPYWKVDAATLWRKLFDLALKGDK